MSYAFRVRKSEGTLQLVNEDGPLEAVAKQIPDGALFTINGHEPGPGTSTSGTIGVNLVVMDALGNADFRGSASGSYNTVSPTPKEA